MSKKILIVALAVFFISFITFNCRGLKQVIRETNGRAANYDLEISALKKQQKKANEDYIMLKETVKSLLPWLNTGFDDSEKGLVLFLDFLEPEILKKMNATVSYSGRSMFQSSPIPLQKSSFEVSFEFVKPGQAESFLEDLLLQNSYPLQVNSAEIRGSKKGEYTTGSVNMDLLLPASLLEMDETALQELGI